MRFLFATFEGGGHVPPALCVAAELYRRGHQVLFISDEANRVAALAAGLLFESWSSAPNRQTLGDPADPLRDWKPRLPPAIVRAVCDGVITGPALAYATDTAAVIDRFAPDAVVSNELLFGAMIAAEAADVPLALLTANVWCYPTRQDVPPFGPGFAPARSHFGQQRQAAARRMIGRWYDARLTDLNSARTAFGLPRLDHCLDQLDACDRILLGVSAAFDYGATAAPEPFVYVGPLGQTPTWARGAAADAALIDPDRPNVLVSFSTTHQDQAATLKRTIQALARLDVNGIVTLGPALAALALPSAPNVKIVERADHDVLVPLCDLVVCHGGHGTVLRPLIHGKPVVCIPSGRDQPENAQRIVEAGAGLRLPRRAARRRIQSAVQTVLADPAFAAGAGQLAIALRRDSVGPSKAVETLEALVVSAGAAPGGRQVLRG